MASAIFFGGRRINIPGAYSRLDTSQLATSSPSATGIVAIIGTAEGGKPLSVAPEDSDHTRTSTVIDRYRPGSDLRTAALFALEPSIDEAVPNGAQRVVAVKVNPATQSSADFDDANGDPSLTLTSRDYGLFTTQINVEIEAGTTQGKKLTIVFEGDTETFDDVGGDPILDIEYTPGAAGYSAATAEITTSALRGLGTRSQTGLDGERAADIPAPGTVSIVSSDAGDTTQQVTIYGLDGSTPVRETLTLNGTALVNGAQNFSSVLGVRMSAAAVGTVTVQDTISTTLFSLTPGQTLRGILAMTNAPIVPSDSSIAIDTGVAGTDAIIVTQSASGSEIMQRLDFTSNAPITLTGTGTRVLYLALGDVPAARTVTLTARMFSLPFATFSTVQRAVDALNVLPGIVANALVSNPTTFLMSDADRAAAVSILTPAVGEFFADLFAVIDTLNTGSLLVSATRAAAPNGNLVPANTTAPVYLTGGVEGTPTINEWREAFNLLRERRVTTIVPLTNDPAVHALLLQHLRERAGRLRSEANGYVGIGTNAGAGQTRSIIKSEIAALQSRFISAISQEMQRFDPDSGERRWYPPHFFAVIAAGMQAGSPIGEPLTLKRPAVLDIRNDPSWSVADDIEEMIDAGLMVAEKREGEGIRWVRSITTHIADDNPIFSEMSSNESADQSVFELRRALERRVGKRGLSGGAAAIKGLANDTLSRLVDDEFIVAYRGLTVEQIGDVFPVSVELAPVEPTNFIPVTVHLVRTRLTT